MTGFLQHAFASRWARYQSLVSHDGRLSVRGYLRHVFKAHIYFGALGCIGMLLGAVVMHIAPQPVKLLLAALVFFPLAVCGFVAMVRIASAAKVKRCHDAGFPGSAGIFSFNHLMPGDSGANAYGPAPIDSTVASFANKR